MSALRISPALLVQAYRIPAPRAALWAPVMQPALELADISTEQRLACWLAQVGHESGRLRFGREIWGPTASQLRYERMLAAPWPASAAQSRQQGWARNRLAYMLGNTQPGDGRRYMGRGLIQTTGRANHRHTALRLRALVGDAAPDVLAAPAMLEAPEWAALSAAVYWRDRGLNVYADAGDFVGLTRRINGGTNGLADRQMLYTQALAALHIGRPSA